MKILLFGAGGQVGGALCRGPLVGHELIALDRRGRAAQDAEAPLSGDLADPAAVAAAVDAVRPDVVINAAAYTAVDRAESEPDLARAVNADAPAAIAQVAARVGAWLIHYSTDYVFGGTGEQSWREDDESAPRSVYGATKLAGEQGIRASGCRHVILRTSWVFGQEGGNFAATMLRLFAERDELKVVADQIGAPTSAEWLAALTAHIITRIDDPTVHGTYHAALAGETSWHGYAEYLLHGARARSIPVLTRELHAVPTTEYPTPARRPLNSRLDCAKLDAMFGFARPDWREAVDAWLDVRAETPTRAAS
ncbi:MAG: dTDP-4-dehydrorhamnose reductase [Betaproteobacteria bacterium]|nr:dTDP-4-dehydrorhamnose reductase [Betaproteobacteria bacterium]